MFIRYSWLVALLAVIFAGGCRKSIPTTPSDSSSGQTGLVLSTTTVNFPTQPVGTTSAEQSLTIWNYTADAVSLEGLISTAEFAVLHTCGDALGSGTSCTITTTFTPAVVGTRAVSLTIGSAASDGPHVILLTGTGGLSQVLELVPTSLTFVNVPVGTTATQGVTVSNRGAATLTVSDVSTEGEFGQTHACGALEPGTSCNITVQFTPPSEGSRTGRILVYSDAPGSPHAAALTGNGLTQKPILSVVHRSVTFTDRLVGTTSPAVTPQFMNIGSAPLNILSIDASGDFAQTNTCPLSLPTNGICTLQVTFTPKGPGPRAGAITIASNASGGPHTIALTGTGIDGAGGLQPQVTLKPALLTFASQVLGSTSGPQTAVLTNSGGAVLTISDVAATGDFAATSGCVTALLPGETCSIDVTFTPSAPGSRAGTLTIGSNSPGSPHTVVLTGTGTGIPGPFVVFSPTSLTFGAQPLGVTGDRQTVIVRNNGSAPLSISSINVEGEFAGTHMCPASLNAGANCSVSVTFTPLAFGTRTGRLIVIDDAEGSPHVVPLGGSGGQGQITLVPAWLSFSDQSVGATSAAQTFTVTNPGTVAVGSISVTVTGDFEQTTDCGERLGGGASCTVTVTFTPTTTGPRGGAVTIADDAPGSPREVLLTGRGVE